MSVERSRFQWDLMPTKVAVTADPAAGANPAEVTLTKRTLLVSCSVQLTTDVNAANRYVTLQVKHDGTNVSAVFSDPAPHTASLGPYYHTLAAGIQGVTSLRTVNVGSLPVGFELPAGAKFQVVISGIQVGDDCSAMYYSYKEAAT